VSNVLSVANPELTGALTTISEGGTIFDAKLVERLGRIRQAERPRRPVATRVGIPKT
jgi:hypothetical protein